MRLYSKKGDSKSYGDETLSESEKIDMGVKCGFQSRAYETLKITMGVKCGFENALDETLIILKPLCFVTN